MKRVGVAALVALAAAGAFACTELNGPLRPARYAFAEIVTDSVTADTTVDGVNYPADTVVTDTVWFHWPQSSLPVKIWADTALGLRDRVTRGLGLWKQILQFGEYDATLVSDSTTADVIVLAGVSPLGSARPARFHSMAPQCEGETDFDISRPDHKKVILPVRVYVQNKFPVDQDSTQACLDLTTAHELGHTLGLFQHSPDSADLMYADPQVDAPSAADASTVLFLYHYLPKLVPVHTHG